MKLHGRCGAAIMGMVALWLCGAARGENWPQFRGPSGMGLSSEKTLPIKWDGKTGENVLWSASLPGEGHASPIVWGNQLITCTVEWSNDSAQRQKMPVHHVTCYQVSDGKQLWDTKIEPGPWLRNDFRSGSGGGYAAPTPSTDGKNIFVAFGSAVMASLDMQGNVVWRKELRPFTFDVTLGSSPVLYEDTVILLCAMAMKSDSRLVAFRKSDGTVKWETRMPTIGFAHSTPLLIEVNGKPQMLVLASGMKVTEDGLQSFDPATGERLWWCKGGGDAASAAYGSGIVYSDSGRGSMGFAVDPTGHGDVSKTHVKWTVEPVPEGLASPIIVNGYVYRLHAPGVLKCWKAATGEEVYSERLEGISSTWASPVADSEGNLYFANGGRSVVVKAGPKFQVLSRNNLYDDNHASAAVADCKLFIEGKKKLYCVGAK